MNWVGWCMNTKDCLCICVDMKTSTAVIDETQNVTFDYVKPPNEYERINDPRMREESHFQLDQNDRR